MWAPGDPAVGWAYNEEGLRATVEFTQRSSRKVAGLVITIPDNSTGLTTSVERQASMGKAVLEAGVPFVLLDRMSISSPANSRWT